MSSELENIILTIDTREQNTKRIKAVEDWAQGHGAIVEYSKLDLCDYRLIGEFHGININLGVEAKALSDFCGSWQDLKDKLARARHELYDEVALFIESGNYTYTYQDGKAFIHNPAVRNGEADVCPLAVYEGLIDTLQQSGIHCRQLRSEAQFPDSLYNLLTYITNEHELIGYTGKGYIPAYKRTLQTLDGIGTKSVEKLIASYPNMHWLSSANEDSIMQVIGKKIGSKLYNFLHCRELQTDDWRNGHHLDGTERFKTICGQDCYNPQHCDTNCIKHPDNPQKALLTKLEVRQSCHGNDVRDKDKDEVGRANKILSKKKQDDEGRLAFDAPAKNPVKCQFDDEKNCAMIDGQCTVACSLNPNYKRCDFANEKNRAECKTPEHFKSIERQRKDVDSIYRGWKDNKATGSLAKDFSHSGKDINSVESDISPHPSLPDDKHNSHEVKGSFRKTNHNSSQPFISDTSQSSDSILNPLSTPKRSGDPQSLPPRELKSEEKHERLSLQFPSHAETNIGLDDKPLECVVRCRACHQVIIPEQDDDTGFCKRPECITERDKPIQKVNLKETIKDFMADGKPHLMQEIVDFCDGWSPGYVFEHIMGAVKSGYFKKITEQNGKTTFQKVNI